MLIYICFWFLLGCGLLKIYLNLTRGWCKSQTCLTGKTAIVTGANTGIGYETALDFAKRGARVIVACRNEEKAEAARARIVKETGNYNIFVKIIDLRSFHSVRTFATDINKTEDRLDILVNNAGIGIGNGHAKSVDGHCLLMQVNYFSSFLLTNLLLDLMKKTKKSRIINVSSGLAKWAHNFRVSNLDKLFGTYSGYCNSKLCNILFTIELANKLKGTDVTTYSLHPGIVQTEIFRNVHGAMKLILDVVKKIFFKTSEKGAQTTIYCAIAKGIEHCNGEHFENCRRIAPYGTVRVPDLAAKVWEKTEEILQLTVEKSVL